jgi:hypothetical protein
MSNYLLKLLEWNIDLASVSTVEDREMKNFKLTRLLHGVIIIVISDDLGDDPGRNKYLSARHGE